MAKTHRIAVVPGDGIGKETVPEALKVLDAASRRFGFGLEFAHYDWSCETYKKTGAMMPADGMERLAQSDSILLGAVGWPDVPDHVSLWGLLIPIRRGFDQYVNLRPCKLMPGVRTPLAGRTEADIDFYVVRENTEGEYSSVGGRMFEGTDREFVSQQSVFSRQGVDRILKYAFELARTRPKKHLTSATKSNGITFTMPYWDERFALMGKSYPDIRTDQYPHRHPVRALRAASRLVRCGGRFQPVRRHPERSRSGGGGIDRHRGRRPTSIPSGSSPRCSSRCTDRRPTSPGRFICNPIGQIWSAALMLEHLGEAAAGRAIVAAIETLLRESGPKTRDMGGQAGTADVGKALAEIVAG